MLTGRIVPTRTLTSRACRRLASQLDGWIAACRDQLLVTSLPIRDLHRGRVPRSLATLYGGHAPWRLLPNPPCIFFEAALDAGNAREVARLADELRHHIEARLVDEITLGSYAIYGSVSGLVEPKILPHSGHRVPALPVRS